MINSDWFKNRMRELGLNQEELGLAIGKNRTTFSRVINGEFEFKLQYIEILANVLKTNKFEIMRHAGLLSNDDFINYKSDFSNVEIAINGFKNGEMLIVTDDYDRENEGDLIVAACHCTPEQMAFIVRHTSGIVCAPISLEIAKRLHLEPMVANNDAPHSTAFTVSIDAKYGTTTGISAEERTTTVRALADNNIGYDGFVRPGHIFPLVAREGGVLVRTGHTEAAVDLCTLANLPPVGVICEMVNDDGSVMRGDDIEKFAQIHKIKRISIAELISYRQSKEKLVTRLNEFTIDTKIGPLRAHAYNTKFDDLQHLAIIYGDINSQKNVLTRLHRADTLEDVFGGGTFINDCLEEFKKNGHGVLIYLRDGAVGVPIMQNLKTNKSKSESTRDKIWREIGVGAQILRDLNISSIDLITRSNHKFAALAGFGIAINKVIGLKN